MVRTGKAAIAACRTGAWSRNGNCSARNSDPARRGPWSGPVAAAKLQRSVPQALAGRAARHLYGLADRVDDLAQNLSGGQKLRVAVARTFVANPDLLLADEPTAALNGDRATKVMELLRRMGWSRGMATLLGTHDNRILTLVAGGSSATRRG